MARNGFVHDDAAKVAGVQAGGLDLPWRNQPVRSSHVLPDEPLLVGLRRRPIGKRLAGWKTSMPTFSQPNRSQLYTIFESDLAKIMKPVDQ